MADEKIAVETIRVTPTISATITDVYFIEFLNGWYLANVRRLAPQPVNFGLVRVIESRAAQMGLISSDWM